MRSDKFNAQTNTMAQVRLNDEPIRVDTSLDNVTIISCLELMVGGRVLDTTGFKPEVIKAGHIIIRDKSTKKEYKPMPVNSNGEAYESLPGTHEVVGVAYSSILSREPLATIMVRGSVNKVSSPYPVTSELEKALPLIRFTQED